MLVLQYLSILALVFVVSLAWHDGPAIGASYANRTGSNTDEGSSTNHLTKL